MTAAIILAGAVPGFSKPWDIDQNTGIFLTDDTGTVLYQKNKTRLFIPASITKILTSICALETLGTGYRFETWAGFDPKTSDLYIKGFGDPLFISEEIRELVSQIIDQTGTGSIRNIILDHSFFHPDITIPGTGESFNPYDATTGALCANFNTVFFQWDKTKNLFVSAEPQTPLLDIFQNDLRSSGQKSGRTLLSAAQRRLYPGRLVKAFFKEKKISVTGKVKEGCFSDRGYTRIVFKSSVTLDRVIEKLLKFSNNFMANQLTLAMGARQYSAPATLEKGINHLRGFARTRIGLSKFILEEGSGLSRKNRFSPEHMIKVLMVFKPHYRLMKRDGTEFYKTGTLTGVRTRAGYFLGQDQRLYPFVIMVNRTGTGYAGIRQRLKALVLQASGRQ